MANSIASLSQEVFVVTRRPDLVTQTAQAVRNATLKLHQRCYYDRDLVEFLIQFDTCEWIQQFPYASLIPNWRALKYFKHPDCHQYPINDRPGNFQRNNNAFKLITTDNIFNYFGNEKQDVCYLSGSNYNLKSSFPFTHVHAGCYLNPIVTPDGYSSWIADNHEFAVVYGAAQLIFKQIGLDAEATTARDDYMEQCAIVDTVNTVGEGY